MIELNGYTLGITRDNGTDINVDIEPVTIDIDGSLTATGVYNLRIDEEVVDNNANYLGQVCFNIEDKYDWQYIDSILTENEIEQIVSSIQRHLN